MNSGNKTALVVALFDIERDKWDNFNLSYETYLGWLKNTLSLDTNIIVYTEDRFVDTIIESRRAYDEQLQKTIIICQPLSQLLCYKEYLPRLGEVMDSEGFKKDDAHHVPETMKPLYNVIMFNKLNFLLHAMNSGYFDADFLVWADAGGLREEISIYERQKWPCPQKMAALDKSKITFFSHNSPINISEDPRSYSLSQIRNIQGTAFIAPVKVLKEFAQNFFETVDESLKSGYIGSDEKILDLTYLKDPSRYSLMHCGWREYFDLFKTQTPNISVVTVTWGFSDSFDISNTFLYKSLKKFSPHQSIEHFHFDRNNYGKAEEDFSKTFGDESEYLLYKLFLLLEKVNDINSKYILFCDATDVTCLKDIESLPSLFDLDNEVIIGAEKNQWPPPETTEKWSLDSPYSGYSAQDIDEECFLNSGIVLASKDNYIKLLENLCAAAVIGPKDFRNDQGVFTYYYNSDGCVPPIRLDRENLLVLNTFKRSTDYASIKDNKLVINSSGVVPFLIHDNGWNHGSPRFNHSLELKRLYSDSYPHLKNISRDTPIHPTHKEYLIRLRDEFEFTPSVIYDVGACVLHWTSIAREVWPDANIFLFEAMEESEELFEESGLPYHIGVYSEINDKEVTFYKNCTFPGGNSYYMENPEHSSMASALFENPANQFSRRTITLDKAREDSLFPFADLLKIDVQGCEVDILRGCPQILNNVQHLIVELQHIEYNKGAMLAEESVEIIKSLGFTLVTPQFSPSSHADADYHFARV